MQRVLRQGRLEQGQSFKAAVPLAPEDLARRIDDHPAALMQRPFLRNAHFYAWGEHMRFASLDEVVARIDDGQGHKRRLYGIGGNCCMRSASQAQSGWLGVTELKSRNNVVRCAAHSHPSVESVMPIAPVAAVRNRLFPCASGVSRRLPRLRPHPTVW